MMREMMEEIFEEVRVENGSLSWYEVFDSDLFEVVCERIAGRLGLDRGEYDFWAEMLDWEVGGEFTEWYNEMSGDL